MTSTPDQTIEYQQRTTHTGPRRIAPIASEVRKLSTVRFPKILGVVAIGLAALTAVLFLLTIEMTQGVQIQTLSTTDIASTALLGVDATAIVLIILGGWIVATEYATGMMSTSLVVTPHRASLFVAKQIVTAGLGLVVGIVAAIATLLTAQAVLSAQGLPVLNLLDPELLRMTFGSLLMVPFYAVLAAAAAFMVRSTGLAVVIALAVMFLPAVVNMLPSAGQELLLPLMPSSALASISGAMTAGDPGHMMPWLAVVLLLAWWAIFIVAGLVRFVRNDA